MDLFGYNETNMDLMKYISSDSLESFIMQIDEESGLLANLFSVEDDSCYNLQSSTQTPSNTTEDMFLAVPVEDGIILTEAEVPVEEGLIITEAEIINDEISDVNTVPGQYSNESNETKLTEIYTVKDSCEIAASISQVSINVKSNEKKRKTRKRDTTKISSALSSEISDKLQPSEEIRDNTQFYSVPYFVNEIDSSKKKKIHCCCNCGAKFNYEHKMLKHLKVHAGNTSFCCEVCGATFHCFNTLAKHMKLHDGNDLWCCVNCKMDFPSLCQYSKHHCFKEVKIKPYTCKKCNAKFCWSVSLNKHKRENKCQSVSYETNDDFTTHNDNDVESECISTHNYENKSICENYSESTCSSNVTGDDSASKSEPIIETADISILGVDFTVRKSSINNQEHDQILDLDLIAANTTTLNNGLVSCNSCGKSFNDAVAFLDHILKPCKKREYICEYCCAKFSSYRNLTYHINFEHLKKPSFPCDICNLQYTHQSSFLRHRKRHAQAFMCPFCEKSFLTYSCLTSHKQMHSHSERFTCDICKESFISLRGLASHKRKHKTDKTVHHDDEVPFYVDGDLDVQFNTTLN